MTDSQLIALALLVAPFFVWAIFAGLSPAWRQVSREVFAPKKHTHHWNEIVGKPPVHACLFCSAEVQNERMDAHLEWHAERGKP